MPFQTLTIVILMCRLTKGMSLNHMGLNQFKMTFKTTVDRKYVSQDYQKNRRVKSSMWYNFMSSRPHCPAQPCFSWNLFFTSQSSQTQRVNLKMIVKLFLTMTTTSSTCVKHFLRHFPQTLIFTIWQDNSCFHLNIMGS